VLRDDNGQHFHGTIPLSESQAYVELRWKPDARGREQVVGLFQLDLQRLLAEGYVRPEGDLDRPDPHVRLRFYRGDRGVVYVQPRSDAPSLAIGTVDLTL